MELTGVGSGIMLAIAAGLWLIYLVPTWLRRREFDATERNAVRLQQTLRVLAETAETPSAVRAETTARSAAEHAKVMRMQERRRAAEARAMALAALRDREVDAAALAAMRLRRSRAGSSIALLVGVVVLVSAFAIVAAGGASIVTAWLIFLGALVSIVAIAVLRRLARVHRPAAARATAPVRKQTSREAPVVVEQPQREWTPVPVPKPLYLAKATVSQRPVTADLVAAAARAEEALRAAQAEPEVTSMPSPAPRPEAAPAPSRFAAMGRVDDSALDRTDLDEVLRRRRAAG